MKSTKAYLKAILADELLTFEEFYTVLVQIESILNAISMWRVSNDPTDLSVLTPGHLLIGSLLTSVPEEGVTKIQVNRTYRFQLLSQLQHSFRKWWSTEYVTQLKSCSKWKTIQTNTDLKFGQLVIIKDDNLPPLKWQLERICELHKSADQLIRVAGLRTARGVLKRSLPKICVLPVSD